MVGSQFNMALQAVAEFELYGAPRDGNSQSDVETAKLQPMSPIYTTRVTDALACGYLERRLRAIDFSVAIVFLISVGVLAVFASIYVHPLLPYLIVIDVFLVIVVAITARPLWWVMGKVRELESKLR